MTFKLIDDALEVYYRRYGYSNYRNEYGNGIFLQYVIDEELNDPELSMEEELGDDADPTDCAYCWMDSHFPLPPYAKVNDDKKQIFIFYILQYCYKHAQAPSDDYIKKILIPQCGRLIDNINNLPAPVAFQQNTNTKPVKECVQLKNNTFAKDVEDMTAKIKETDHDIEIIRMSGTEFKPKYPAREDVNIYTGKELTKELPGIISEEFENDLLLYYFTDMSTRLQSNDSVAPFSPDARVQSTYTNLDHNCDREPTPGVYRFISSSTDQSRVHSYETKEEYSSPDCINTASPSIVKMKRWMDQTDWEEVIKNSNGTGKRYGATVTIDRRVWIEACVESIDNPELPILAGLDDGNKLEYLKIVEIEAQNIYMGISFGNIQDQELLDDLLLRGFSKPSRVPLDVHILIYQFWDGSTFIKRIYFNLKDIDRRYELTKAASNKDWDQIIKTSVRITHMKFEDEISNEELQSDDDIALHNGNNNIHQLQQQLLEYKKAFETEQIRNIQLSRTLQQSNHVYVQQLNALKQEHEQYLMQQQMMAQQHQPLAYHSSYGHQPQPQQQQFDVNSIQSYQGHNSFGRGTMSSHRCVLDNNEINLIAANTNWRNIPQRGGSHSGTAIQIYDDVFMDYLRESQQQPCHMNGSWTKRVYHASQNISATVSFKCTPFDLIFRRKYGDERISKEIRDITKCYFGDEWSVSHLELDSSVSSIEFISAEYDPDHEFRIEIDLDEDDHLQ